MAAPHTSVKGLKETLKNLENAKVNIESCVRTACWKHGARIMMQAKNNARTLFDHPTGRLMGSITTRANFSPKEVGLKSPAQPDDAVNRPGGNGKGDPVVVVGTNVEYGRRIELGFVGTDSLGRKYNQAAKSYLFPAFFSLENDFDKTIISVVREKQACENFKKRLPIFEPEGSWE
jgi:transcription elongation factor